MRKLSPSSYSCLFILHPHHRQTRHLTAKQRLWLAKPDTEAKLVELSRACKHIVIFFTSIHPEGYQGYVSISCSIPSRVYRLTKGDGT